MTQKINVPFYCFGKRAKKYCKQKENALARKECVCSGTNSVQFVLMLDFVF